MPSSQFLLHTALKTKVKITVLCCHKTFVSCVARVFPCDIEVHAALEAIPDLLYSCNTDY